MITYSDKCIDSWSKKIIFAPNGFGKTLSSAALEKDLQAKGNHPIVFTRRKVEQLVDLKNGSIFVGETARESAENQTLIEEYQKKKILRKVLENLYGISEVEKVISKSYLFSTFAQKELDGFQTAISLHGASPKKSSLVCYSTNNILFSDSQINKTYLRRIQNLLGPDNLRGAKSPFLSSQTYSGLFQIEKTIQKGLTKASQKPVQIENQLEELQNRATRDFATPINDAAKTERLLFRERIGSLSNVLTLNLPDFLLALFPLQKDNKNAFTHQLFILLLYRTWAKVNTQSLAQIISKSKVGSDSIDYYVETYSKNKRAIAVSGKKILSKRKFIEAVREQFFSIVSCDSKIDLKADIKNLSLKIMIDERPVKMSAYNFFSESEIKRLALAIMEVSIEYGIYDGVIFDDPIDSYDDYYLLVACQYVQKTVENKSLKYWYIFTNNYTALNYFSQILKAPSILYFEDPSLFKGPQPKTLSYEAGWEEIVKTNISELSLLKDFLEKDKATYDPDLAFLALVITLRNVKTNVVGGAGFGRIRVVLNDGPLLLKNRAFDKKTHDIIEHCYLHYCPRDNGEKLSSDSITIANLFSLFSQITKKRGELLKKYECQSENAVAFRERIALDHFPPLGQDTPLNVILKKMVMLNYLKYEMERQLIELLRSRFGFSRSEIQTIVDTDTLGKKIKKAKKISESHSPEKTDVSCFLSDVEQTFNKFRILLNDSDHTITRMLPPYLAISVRDIKELNSEIQKMGKNTSKI